MPRQHESSRPDNDVLRAGNDARSRMLGGPDAANAKYIYALDMWTVEKRPSGWYFSKSAYHGAKHDWRGPYTSEASVTLMIARELRREIIKRHKL